MQARKILLEFLGKIWGDGNTILHLASFLGMSHLVQRLLDLGANASKRNHRSYSAVDCADDNETRDLFLKVNEGNDTKYL
jgi:ankyrin repeat protein